jgi:hypothetical protein
MFHSAHRYILILWFQIITGIAFLLQERFTNGFKKLRSPKGDYVYSRGRELIGLCCARNLLSIRLVVLFVFATLAAF